MHHLPEFNSLLEKYGGKNQLTRACKIYLESNFIVDSLAALSKMVELVSLPFLELVQESNCSKLLVAIPQLYIDLKANRNDTLKDFVAPFNLKLGEENECRVMMMNLFASAMGDGLKQQRGREFGFFDDEEATRGASILSKIDVELLDGLLTHNIDAERDLSIFDRLARKAAPNYNENCDASGNFVSSFLWFLNFYYFLHMFPTL